VQRHGSESYFVIGEGLLTESVGGRELSLADADEAQAPPFRFTRMGPKGPLPSEATLRRLADSMIVSAGRGSTIPAGFTYLGQFVDHDLTFDRTDVTFGDHVAPADLLQARSPSLDLDSLYGAGPADPGSSAFFESDGLHLKMGTTASVGSIPAKAGFDLPRGTGASPDEKREALIPDPRNDENLAVAQTHLAFIRFHNHVVDTLPTSIPSAQKFRHARELVTKHYQWMLRTDFLPRICSKAIVNDVFTRGRKVFEVGASPIEVPTMPIEFSVAAFRFGHSMVRGAYSWNKEFDDGAGTLDLLFAFSGHSGDLFGGDRLPSNWIADFRRLYDFAEAGRADLAIPEAKFNLAMKIDTTLVDPLRTLPGLPVTEPKNLALRNLRRARMVRLATGQQMAGLLGSKGVAFNKLTKTQIREGNNGAVLDRLTRPQRDALLGATPLWFYILREAELNRGKLNGVGARIVAETFHRAIEGSQHSIVRDATWRPTFGPDESFRMVDLLLFAFEGKKTLLAPLG